MYESESYFDEENFISENEEFFIYLSMHYAIETAKMYASIMKKIWKEQYIASCEQLDEKLNDLSTMYKHKRKYLYVSVLKTYVNYNTEESIICPNCGFCDINDENFCPRCGYAFSEPHITYGIEKHKNRHFKERSILIDPNLVSDSDLKQIFTSSDITFDSYKIYLRLRGYTENAVYQYSNALLSIKCHYSSNESVYSFWNLNEFSRKVGTQINLKSFHGVYKPALKRFSEFLDMRKAVMVEGKDISDFFIEIQSENRNLDRNFNSPVATNGKKTVTIKGIVLPIYRSPYQKVQDFVKQTLETLFHNNLLSSEEIKRLQNEDYCKQTFDIQFPLLESDFQKTIVAGHSRYWTTFRVNEFYVCSQWWKQNFKLYDEKIAIWLRNLERQEK